MDEALIVCRLVQFAALFALFGGGAFRIYALGASATCNVIADFDRWFARFSVGATVLVLLSGLAILAATAAMMAGSGAAAIDPAVLRTVLTETQFGQIWCGRLLVAALLVAASIVLSPPSRDPAVLALSGLLLISLGLVGHAAMNRGALRLVHEMNQVAHLIAGAFWLGGLLPLGWFLVRLRRTSDPEWLALAPKILPRFSRVGYGAVALLAVTGVVNSVLLVGSPAALFDTQYGRLLLLKIVLFLAMLALACINRFRLTPLIVQQSGPAGPLTALARSVMTEQGLALAILAVVSVLGTLPPAIYFGHH